MADPFEFPQTVMQPVNTVTKQINKPASSFRGWLNRKILRCRRFITKMEAVCTTAGGKRWQHLRSKVSRSKIYRIHHNQDCEQSGFKFSSIKWYKASKIRLIRYIFRVRLTDLWQKCQLQMNHKKTVPLHVKPSDTVNQLHYIKGQRKSSK